MKGRILSIALVLSMLAVGFAAVPTTAAVDYTGSVTTTDDTGTPKTVFIEGDHVYVNVEVLYRGTHSRERINVELWRPGSVWPIDEFTSWADQPSDGWYNSSTTGVFLRARMWGGDPDAVVYDVAVNVGGIEFARSQIVVKREGLKLDPVASPYYYPGQTVTITYITSHAEDFYVEIVNETGVAIENWTSQEAVDAWWGATWNIDSNAADGQYWLRVRAETSNAVWENVTLWIQKYQLFVYSDRYNVLPGDSVVFTYVIQDYATKTAYAGASIAWQAYYYNSSGNRTNISGALPGAAGSQTYTVPTDIAMYSDIWFTFWANETGTTRTYEIGLTLHLGQLSADVAVDRLTHMPGDLVVITVTADIAGEPLPGAAASVEVSRNGTVLGAYGSADLVTALNGAAVHTFTLIDDAAQGVYVVNATISKVGFSVNRMTMFEVDWDGELILHLNKDTYYGGEEATLSFRVLWNNKEVSANIGYVATGDTGIIQTGNSSGDDVTIAIPDNYYGGLSVSATTNLNGHMLSDVVSADVRFADIALNVQNTHYRPGDTLVFDYDIVTGLSSGNLEYAVFDNDGVKVAGEALAFEKSGSFEYDVPTAEWSDGYNALLVMTDGAGGYASASASADIISDYTLRIWVERSGYASGEFKPGDTATVHYSIESYVFDHLPVYRLLVYISGDPVARSILVNEPTGTFTYEIPSDAYSGGIGISAYLYDPMDPMGGWISNDYATIMVNNNLSGWDRSIGGMSAIDFTLLLLIVIMIILLIVIPFLRTRMGREKPEKPAKLEPAKPPEPGPP
ncbi:MAG: hypothetical protein ACUVT7_00345 [Thermoplasmata archaeon]